MSLVDTHQAPLACSLPVLARLSGWLLVLLVSSSFIERSCATRVAVLGDFGLDGPGEASISALIRGWDAAERLDAIVTTGDNNYPVGDAATFQNNVGKHYSQFISPNSTSNRFWPVPGNHDWGNDCPNPSGIEPYQAYFKALGGKLVYDVMVGPDMHFFMMDSDCNEPMGRALDSKQGQWLKAGLAASKAVFKVVIFHHPPYTSGSHASTTILRWPFEEWGADVILNGHDHTYERLSNPRAVQGREGFPYIVNGLGGAEIYDFSSTSQPASVVRYNDGFGAQLLTSRSVPPSSAGDAGRRELDLAFLDRKGAVVDCWRVIKAADAGLTAAAATTYAACGQQPPPPQGSEYSLLTNKATNPSAPSPEVVWRYYNGGTAAWDPAPATSWVSASYSDSGWQTGASPLGFGPDLAWQTELAKNSKIPSGTQGYYYFRYRLCLPAELLSKLGALTLKVLSDNGARVFVNGVMVHDDLTADHDAEYWNGVKELKASGLLVAGENVIAVQVSNTPGSSDTGFDLDITYEATSPLTPAPTKCPAPAPLKAFSLLTHKMVPSAGVQGPGASWKYFNGGKTDLSRARGKPWVTLAYADEAWKLGASPLGYGPGVAWKTALEDNAAMPSRRAYYYFRTKVCLPADVAAQLPSLAVSLAVLSDNGARVFINAALAHDDLKANHDARYWNTLKSLKPAGLLAAGENVIAAQVSNTAGSSDTGFDLDIIYMAAAPLAATPLVCP